MTAADEQNGRKNDLMKRDLSAQADLDAAAVNHGDRRVLMTNAFGNTALSENGGVPMSEKILVQTERQDRQSTFYIKFSLLGDDDVIEVDGYRIELDTNGSASASGAAIIDISISPGLIL